VKDISGQNLLIYITTVTSKKKIKQCRCDNFYAEGREICRSLWPRIEMIQRGRNIAASLADLGFGIVLAQRKTKTTFGGTFSKQKYSRSEKKE
jgi:hypothetical protein